MYVCMHAWNTIFGAVHGICTCPWRLCHAAVLKRRESWSGLKTRSGSEHADSSQRRGSPDLLSLCGERPHGAAAWTARGSGWRLVIVATSFSSFDPVIWCCGSYPGLVKFRSNPSGLNPMLPGCSHVVTGGSAHVHRVWERCV